MKGKILSYDDVLDQGIISGQDDNRYDFKRSEWDDPKSNPKVGCYVDFVAEDTWAKNIYKIQTNTAGGKNKVVAALLAFFLGAFGAQEFYLRRPLTGVGMLLCSVIGIIVYAINAAVLTNDAFAGTTPSPSNLIGAGFIILPIIMGLIAFIQFIVYLVTSQEKFDEKYNS